MLFRQLLQGIAKVSLLDYSRRHCILNLNPLYVHIHRHRQSLRGISCTSSSGISGIPPFAIRIRILLDLVFLR